MVDMFGKIGMAAALGTLVIAGGMSGCSSISTNHVDCTVVKLQRESGRTDAEIASAIGASVKEVTECRMSRPSTTKSTTTAIPSDY